MNIQNISALVKQLQLLGLEDVSYPLLKRIAFKPDSFFLSKKIERGNDLVSLQIFFQKKRNEDVYELAYYDAALQAENEFREAVVNGVETVSLEKQMDNTDWRKAFDLDEQKDWNANDKSSWEKEQKIAQIISDLLALESTEEGKIVAGALKLKYWNGAPYHQLFDNMYVPKAKAEISQRFYFSEGQGGISIEEAYRFLQNRRIEKNLFAKRKQPEDLLDNHGVDKASNSSGSGLLKKRKINSGRKGKKNRQVNQ